MKQISWHRITLLLMLLMVVSGSVVAKKKQKKKTVETTVVAQEERLKESNLSEADRRRLTYFFMEAKKQNLARNFTATYELLRYCLSIDPNSSAALYEMALQQYILQEDSVGLSLLEKAAEYEPRNSQFLEILAMAYTKKQDYAKTTEVYEKLAKLQPTRSEIQSRLVQLYKYNEQPEKAIEAIDKLELLEGKATSTSLDKYNLYMDMGREEEAFDAVKSLCEENPHDMQSRLMLADLYVDKDRMEEAWALYEEVKATDPKNTTLQSSILNYYEKTEQKEAYQRLRDSLLYDMDVPSELRVKVISNMLSSTQDTTEVAAIDTVFTHLFSLGKPDVYMLRAYMLYQIYHKKASDDEVLSTLWRILEVSPDDMDVTMQLLRYYLGRGELKQVEALCKQGIQYHSNELPFHYFAGVSIYQQDRSAEAALAVETGLRHVTEESATDLVSDMYALLGDIYHEMGREREAYEAYDSCLVYNEDNISCLNNYAYYLSVKRERLDDAEKMSYKTIRKEPTNKTYLDTYAWILFEQGDYEMAKSYIDRVVEPDAADSTLMNDSEISSVVIEHAGDIYSRCGQMDKALRYWKLALTGNKSNATLKKKIKLKKYVRK